jgi:hypothetical protein
MRLDTGEAPPAGAKPMSPAAAPRPKQTLDQTRIIPQGVKLDELTSNAGPPELSSTTGFEKKSDRGGKIFAILVIVVGLALVGALVWVLFMT